MRENSQSQRGEQEGEEEKNRGSRYCSQSVAYRIPKTIPEMTRTPDLHGNYTTHSGEFGLDKTMAQPTCPGYPKSNLASWTLFVRR